MEGILGYIILQMPRRKKCDPERMKAAIEAMRNKGMGSYKASRFFNLLQTTLKPYVKDGQKSSSEAIKAKPGRKPVLPCQVESDLAEHSLLMERKFFWLESGSRHASHLPTCCKKWN